MVAFEFLGESYEYFSHKYNNTWKNERAIEVPIMWKIVKGCRGRVLEVGNVLSHYCPISHDVVDKYELEAGVINEDIIDFRPMYKYDLIVSISTLEHVGWDEKPQDSSKVLVAIQNMKTNCLADGGTMVLTMPLGYNPEVDRLLAESILDLGRKYYMKRLSIDNEWRQTDWFGVKGTKYGTPFPCANAIVISIFEEEDSALFSLIWSSQRR